MTIMQMLGQSGLLTLLGMGVVFSFIIILILSMTVLQKVLHALKLDKDKEVSKVKVAPAATVKANEDMNAIVCAIATAIKRTE